jgi:hypothetical protein
LLAVKLANDVRTDGFDDLFLVMKGRRVKGGTSQP